MATSCDTDFTDSWQRSEEMNSSFETNAMLGLFGLLLLEQLGWMSKVTCGIIVVLLLINFIYGIRAWKKRDEPKDIELSRPTKYLHLFRMGLFLCFALIIAWMALG